MTILASRALVLVIYTDSALTILASRTLRLVIDTDSALTILASRTLRLVIDTDSALTILASGALRLVVDTDSALTILASRAFRLVVYADSALTILAPDALRLTIDADSAHTIFASDAFRLAVYAGSVDTILASDALGLVIDADRALTILASWALRLVVYANSGHTSLASDALRLAIYANSGLTILASRTLRLAIDADIVHTIFASRALILSRAAAGNAFEARVGCEIANVARSGTLRVVGAAVGDALDARVVHTDFAFTGTFAVVSTTTRNLVLDAFATDTDGNAALVGRRGAVRVDNANGGTGWAFDAGGGRVLAAVGLEARLHAGDRLEARNRHRENGDAGPAVAGLAAQTVRINGASVGSTVRDPITRGRVVELDAAQAGGRIGRCALGARCRRPGAGSALAIDDLQAANADHEVTRIVKRTAGLACVVGELGIGEPVAIRVRDGQSAGKRNAEIRSVVRP